MRAGERSRANISIFAASIEGRPFGRDFDELVADLVLDRREHADAELHRVRLTAHQRATCHVPSTPKHSTALTQIAVQVGRSEYDTDGCVGALERPGAG